MKELHTLLVASMAAAWPICTSAQLPPYVPPDDLAGWWPFNGYANDVSGNDNNGTAYGATITNDRFGDPGSAYAFNGTDAYIEVPDAPALRLNNDSYTIAWWALVDTYNSPATAFVVKRGAGPQNGWMVVANGLYDNMIEMKTSGGADPEIRCDTALAPGAWFHFAIVNDATVDSILFFANGVEVFRQASGGLYYNPNSTSPMRFGSDTSTPAGTYFLSGAMDDIGIWSRRLTAQEVLDLYLNTNVSVEEIREAAAEVFFDATADELVLRVPQAFIGTTYAILDASGRLVQAGVLQSDVTRLSVRDGSGVYMVRFDAQPGDAVRVVNP
ncbi:MAG: LamG domain-containing protein [Flavobacteriales bacterium]|nr:MAG: LamG domain-containing protein [Flavobacteriales bacterium]